MKKLLTIALLLLAALTAGAQEGWSTGVTKADELYDLKAERYYAFHKAGVGYFTFDEGAEWQFSVITDKGTFETWILSRTDGSAPSHYVHFIMGLYDMNGNMLDRLQDNLQTSYRDRTVAWVNEKWTYSKKSKKFLKRALAAIMSGEGYLRIVLHRNRMEDWQLTVPPLPAKR